MKKFVCIALAACFMVALVSFSSAAANVSGSVEIDDISFWAVNSTPSWFGFTRSSGNVFTLSISGDVAPEPYFSYIYLAVTDVPPVPSVDGRVVYLSLSVDLNVFLDNSLRWAYETNGDILAAAAFRNCQFYIGSTFIPLDAYVLRAPDGSVIDNTSVDFWRSHAQSGYNIEVNILVDITSYLDTDLNSVWFYFPGAFGQEGLWGSSYDDIYELQVNSVSLDYVYRPFNDVVQDDLTDIKGQLGTLNSTMNTIDQDVNRVNQSVTDLKDIIEDFQDDLTTSDSSISSDISDKEDIINSIQDAMQNDNALLEDNLNDMITGFPGAQDPFHDAPSPDGFFAVQFIQQLWSFIKAQTVFFDFIFLGLCFCLATFILRR